MLQSAPPDILLQPNQAKEHQPCMCRQMSMDHQLPGCDAGACTTRSPNNQMNTTHITARKTPGRRLCRAVHEQSDVCNISV